MERLSRGPARARRRVAGALAASLLLSLPCHAERPRVYAITGAHVVPAPGQVLDPGTIVLRDGLVEAVGASVEAPADAEVIEGAGLFVYPGLIEPDSRLGQRESAEAAPSRAGAAVAGRPAREARETPAGAAHPLAGVRPERRARDALVPFEGDAKREAERYRDLGFTTALTVPGAGVFRGTSAVILLLDDAPVRAMLLSDEAAAHVAFDAEDFGGSYPTSLMGAAATIRQALLDADRFRTWSERYARDPRGMPRPEHVEALAALAPVIAGERPAFFHAASPQDVLLADRIADEFGLRAVIEGSGHEWEIAAEVRAADRPLLLPVAFPDKPKVNDEDEALDVPLRTLRRYLEAPSAARRLHEAGVRFAFTTQGLKNLADFPRNLRRIVEAGLPEDVALAALTTVPADLLGIGGVAGTLEPGKIANLVVLDGPLFGEKSAVKRVFVDGVEYRAKERKKPKGDPNAVVDPRGEWSVVFEFGARTVQRTWTIEGGAGAYAGSAETESGTVEFESVTLAGNMLTVVFPPRGDRPSMEVTVVITGDTFEGTLELGARSAPISGTRTRPGGGAA